MADKKKNTIVDEALLDIKVIQEALQKNTKEILRSTMHEEIDQIVKEYVTNEQGYEEEEVEDAIDTLISFKRDVEKKINNENVNHYNPYFNVLSRDRIRYRKNQLKHVRSVLANEVFV